MPFRDLILAITVPILWGVGITLTKLGMEQFPPMLINGLRWSLTGLILVWWFPIPRKYLKNHISFNNRMYYPILINIFRTESNRCFLSNSFCTM